jgi:hypothetical protein
MLMGLMLIFRHLANNYLHKDFYETTWNDEGRLTNVGCRCALLFLTNKLAAIP